MKKNLFLIAFFMMFAVVFEFHPAVEWGRIYVPEEIYAGKDCGCECIANSRPWYSKFNYWFWLWVVSVPLFVFSIMPDAPEWQKVGRTLAAIGFCYVLMNLAMQLSWDIRNGPFYVRNMPDQLAWNMGCANTADGASLAFTRLFGWLYATVYTGWWDMVWYQYHKRKTGEIDHSFKRDFLNKIVVAISKIIPALGVIFVFFTWAFLTH